MSLAVLKPRLTPMHTSKVRVLEVKAGATQMERGRAWMQKRERVALTHGYRCAGCGLVWRSNKDQIDHRIPREQGGSNEESNLQPLCKPCHDAKTAAEAGSRATGGGAGSKSGV